MLFSAVPPPRSTLPRRAHSPWWKTAACEEHMHRKAAAVFVVASAIVLSALRVSVQVPSEPAPLADAFIAHVGVVVPDIEAAARKYADLFGLDPIAIRTAPVDLPDGSKV